MSAVERLKESALGLDSAALESRLRALDADERTEARAWVLADKAFFELVRDRERPIISSADREARAFAGTAVWMRIMCLVALCSPAEAARAIRWGDVWGHKPAARDRARQLLADRPREWAQTFLTTTAALRVSQRDADTGGRCLAWLVERGLADHALPCPEGISFLGHAEGYAGSDPDAASRFRANRLNPDLLYLKIAAGFAAHYDGLRTAVDDLLAEGLLDRRLLLETCLQSLTIQTRVGSQRAVAKILTALDVRSEEIPGGLSFLTGAIATCDGSVGAVLLPLALQAVVDTAQNSPSQVSGLEDLTRVIAGRKERKQKRVLLTWLRTPATVAALGIPEVLVALSVLAAGEEDASLLRGIEAARSELGAPEPTVGPETEPSLASGGDVVGLWHLDLEPGPPRERAWWMRDTLTSFLNRHEVDNATATEVIVDEFVHSLAGSGGVEEFVSLCRTLRTDGKLAVSRCARLIEAAFLAGGLRVMWPAALEIADDVASAGRVPAGLPELLRLLARYAREVPDGWALPPHLARMASAPGTSKSQLEARALGAALARVTTTDYTHGAVEEPAVLARGLWELRPQGPVLGRLLDPHDATFVATKDEILSYLLAIGNGLAERFYSGRGTGHQHDNAVIRELAMTVQTGNLETVRARISNVRCLPGSDQGPTWQALKHWVNGQLTPQTYDAVLATHRGQGPSLDHVVFAWTCEQLVRLTTHPGLLSRAENLTGMVRMPTLVNHLRSFADVATVGPIDLLITLTRLQVAPEETDDALEALAAVPSVWTDPDVTRTTTGTDSFDIVPVIRGWIASGGMNATDLPLDVGLFSGLTERDLRGPASHEDVLLRVWPHQRGLPHPEPSRYSSATRIELRDGRLPADVWARLLGNAVSEYVSQREDSLHHITELARFDPILDPAVTVGAALSRLANGDLPLGRFSDAMQRVFEHGGLRQLWPLGMAVAAAATAQTPKPPGLAMLLSVLCTYAHEVPAGARTVPPEIAALAAATSASKSRTVARDLVAALSKGTA